MILRNTSTHPTEEVRALIALAAESYDLRRVAVEVKGTKYPYRGLAYSSVPLYLRHTYPKAQYLVRVFIGSASKYAEPHNNLRERRRWVRMDPDEIAPLLTKTRAVLGCTDGSGTAKVLYRQRLVVKTAPYGGRGAPLIFYHTWQEAMVGVAAHEFHHIRQYQNGQRATEAYCERAAAAALERYRAQKSGRGGSIPPA